MPEQKIKIKKSVWDLKPSWRKLGQLVITSQFPHSYTSVPRRHKDTKIFFFQKIKNTKKKKKIKIMLTFSNMLYRIISRYKNNKHHEK